MFVIIPDNEEGESLKQEVAQLISKVTQPETETSFEYRLTTLESSIKEKNFFFKITTFLTPNQQKKAPEKAEVGIRTRVVASTGLLFFSSISAIKAQKFAHFLFSMTNLQNPLPMA